MKKIVLSFAKTDIQADTVSMPPARAERYEQISDPDASRQYAAASAALCAVLGENAHTFRYGENGRPEADGIYISLAHTSGIAVCAAADIPVGVDIEKTSRVFSDAMKKHFPTVDDWLAFEACAKMTGEGLGARGRYVRDGSSMFDQSGAHIADTAFIDHGLYRACICCPEEFELEITE